MEILLLCIKIFFVRILDVSLGTVRTIITVKGKKLIASCVGFFEVFIWFIIVKEALNTDSTSIWVAIAYAGGFATGTYIGTWISEIFIRGNVSVQVITSKRDDTVVQTLRNEGYAVSVLEAKGQHENRYLLFIEIDQRKVKPLKKEITKLDPRAFIVVNETKSVMNGYFSK